LSNDRAFSGLVKNALGSMRNQQDPESDDSEGGVWLIYLQVMDFDQIEDLIGFRAARNIESMLAARLIGTTGVEVSPSRMGNGIFTMLLQELRSQTVEEFAKRLYNAFEGELFGSGREQTRIRVSIGAVRLDSRLGDPNQYLSAATQAALMARERLPRIQKVFDVEGMMVNRRSMTERLELLKDALSDNRLVLYAQPICALQKPEKTINYEILIRLRDPNGDVLSPGVFLPIAEAYGFMQEIDQWVIQQTLNTLASNPQWLEVTGKCSINLAGVSLTSDGIVDFIKGALESSGVPPERIGFEVTETQQIQSRDAAEQVIGELRDLGCGVSIDDFGTGLATFDYLRSFRFDTLKIDGIFVKSIEDNENDKCMVKAMCDVAATMGLKTVAEFVENERIAGYLAELGVDYGQGFGLGKPEPIEQFLNARIDLATGPTQNVQGSEVGGQPS
jgi:EAL domain-containing protein (putative c-di-GMP-specific phosphodiesterase class I)